MALVNTTLREMGEILAGADSVLLFPHVNPDPDAIGSCAALCRVLRQLGKEAWILMDQPVPSFIDFLTAPQDGQDQLDTVKQSVIQAPDVCICIDCCEEKRFPGRVKTYRSGGTTLCIDHHRVYECNWDRYYIDPAAPAAAQIVWALLQEMGWEIDTATAGALYTGIAGDTGSFQYSNTTPQCHRVAADLMERGVDINAINVRLYQNMDLRTVRVRVQAMETMEILAGGKAAIARISLQEREALGAGPEHLETVIDDLRNIAGVEVAAFLKEEKDRIRVSLRSKTSIDVAQIAEQFDGGGHTKAAGCTMQEPLDQAYEKLRAAVERAALAMDTADAPEQAR